MKLKWNVYEFQSGSALIGPLLLFERQTKTGTTTCFLLRYIVWDKNGCDMREVILFYFIWWCNFVHQLNKKACRSKAQAMKKMSSTQKLKKGLAAAYIKRVSLMCSWTSVKFCPASLKHIRFLSSNFLSKNKFPFFVWHRHHHHQLFSNCEKRDFIKR